MKEIAMIMAVIALCISAHTASAAPIISVGPESIEVTQGETFTVNITVDPEGSEIMSAQYDLHFDNTLLNVVDQSEGAFLSHDGANTVAMSNRFNNTIGKTEYGETRTGVSTGVITSGILATITFNATEPGVCALILDNVILSDPEAKEIPDVSISGGTCNIKTAEQTQQTPTSTPTATATTLSTITATPTQTPTSAPTTPVTTATVVQTNAISPTPLLLEPHSTATPSTTPAHPSEKNMMRSGFALTFTTIGLLVVSYTILKRKR